MCPAAPRSQLRPEAGPCRRSASAAPREGAQRSDVHFRGLSVIGTSGVSRVGEGPRTAGTRRPPVQDRITHPGRLTRPRANHSQPCGAARRSTCPFSLPCRHPRQHRDVLAPMCIACALHTRLSAHTTPTLPPPSCAGQRHGTGVKWTDTPLHLRPVHRPGRLQRHHHRGRRRPPPPASLARRLHQEAPA